MTQQIAWLIPLIRVPNRLEATVELAQRWMKATQEERDAIVVGWSFGVEWPYPPPARLACTVGETGTPLQRIRAALLLNWIESHEEPREQAVFLCDAYNSCRLAGLDADHVFNEVASTLPQDAGEVLRRFCRRSEADKTISAFGFVAMRDQNGETELMSVPFTARTPEEGSGLYGSGFEREDWYLLKNVLIEQALEDTKVAFGRLPMRLQRSRVGLEIAAFLDAGDPTRRHNAIDMMAPGMSNVFLLLEKA